MPGPETESKKHGDGKNNRVNGGFSERASTMIFVCARKWIACSLLVVPSAARAGADDPPRLTLLVPAYFYPAEQGLREWDRLIAAAHEAPIVAIANPASGPGERIDPNYRDVINRASKAGVKVIGYVTLSYGKRPAADVRAEVDRWLEFHPQIAGIFFDEQPSDDAHVEHCAKIYAHARRKLPKGLLISNPGVACHANYFTETSIDAICIFEHKQGFDEFQRPADLAEQEARRFAALSYDTDRRTMRHRLDRMLSERIGYAYITDRDGVNPWDRLPAYWDAEVAEVRRANESADK
jgi:hypothetical protein